MSLCKLKLKSTKSEAIKEIDENELKDKQRIGAGKSGVVYKAMYNGQPVAWKMFDFAQADKDLEETIRDFCQELAILSRISHPNIVKFIGYNLQNSLSIIMELLPGKNLDDALKPYENDKDLSWHLLIKIALDIIQALNYLHSLPQKVSHNDLKPDNIMVFDLSFDAEVSVKLVDFGFSISTHSEENLLSRDIKSFSSMFQGIIKYYCDPHHPTAIICHSDQQINLPRAFSDILDNYLSYTSETLEFAVMKLYNSIQSSKLNSSSATALKSCSDVVFMRYVTNEVINQPATPIIVCTTTNLCYINHFIYKWIKENNMRMLENFFLYVDVNIYFQENMDTALIIAAKLGSVEVIKFLLGKPNINVNLTNELGYSALHVASLNAKPLCVSILRTHPAIDINLATASIEDLQNLNPLELCIFTILKNPKQIVNLSYVADQLVFSGAELTSNSLGITHRFSCIEHLFLSFLPRFVGEWLILIENNELILNY